MSSRTATTSTDNASPRKKNFHMARRAASRIVLGGDLRIRNHPDARCNYTRQLRKRLSNDVVSEGHRAQEEADDSLVEADHIDRRQSSQQGLEPEPQHLLPATAPSPPPRAWGAHGPRRRERRTRR